MIQNSANDFYTFASALPAGSDAVIPISSGSWISQANGLAVDRSNLARAGGADLGRRSTHWASPTPGRRPSEAPNTTYYQSTAYGYNIYTVVPTAKLSGFTQDAALESLFVGSRLGALLEHGADHRPLLRVRQPGGSRRYVRDHHPDRQRLSRTRHLANPPPHFQGDSSMRSTHAVTQRLAPRGSIRTRGSRMAASAKILTAGLVAAGSMTALVVAESVPASASTVNGIASIADPVTLNVVTSGGSTTPFTVVAAAPGGVRRRHGDPRLPRLQLPGAERDQLVGADLRVVPLCGLRPGGRHRHVLRAGQHGHRHRPDRRPSPTASSGDRWCPTTACRCRPFSTRARAPRRAASGRPAWSAPTTAVRLADNWNTEVTFHASIGRPQRVHVDGGARPERQRTRRLHVGELDDLHQGLLRDLHARPPRVARRR